MQTTHEERIIINDLYCIYVLKAEHATDDLGIKHAPLIVTDRFPRVIIEHLNTTVCVANLT